MNDSIGFGEQDEVASSAQAQSWNRRFYFFEKKRLNRTILVGHAQTGNKQFEMRIFPRSRESLKIEPETRVLETEDLSQ
jgi:hypothetical protein